MALAAPATTAATGRVAAHAVGVILLFEGGDLVRVGFAEAAYRLAVPYLGGGELALELGDSILYLPKYALDRYSADGGARARGTFVPS